MERHCSHYYCNASHCEKTLLKGISVVEGLILKSSEPETEVFLVHGHQGDFLNDTLWPLARFLVRYVWRRLELAGFLDPTGAKERGKILIAGHTHRPVFSAPSQGSYFNTGSCVHPRCITGIEIENNEITLIKWSVRSREDRVLSVEREVLEGPVCISDYHR